MKYYAVISKDEAFTMNKKEWREFCQTHKGFHAVRFDTLEEAELEVNIARQTILFKEEQKPVNGKYLCFYDSEFNACNYNDGKPQEIISMGIVITDKDGNHIDEFYSTVRLKVANEVTKRCHALTVLTTEVIAESPAFYKVCADAYEFISKYKVGSIYALGKDDKKQFLETASLYNQTPAMKKLAGKFVNIRNVFREKTSPQVSELSLKNLKRICGLKGEVSHNALQDSKDLADVYHVLHTTGYSESEYKNLLKERNDKALYDKSRNFSEEDSLPVTCEVLKAKETIKRFLSENDKGLNPIVLKAFLDDLEVLFKSENV